MPVHVLNYYNCNKDSIWIASVVFLMMFVFIILLKIVVYAELYEIYGICSPFSFGNKKTCTTKIQNEIINSKYKESFVETQHDGQYATLKDIFESLQNSTNQFFVKLLKFHLGVLKILSDIIQYLSHQLNKMYDANKNIISTIIKGYIDPFLYKLLHPIIRLV
jgi:hypothetical protein